jgi:hypothetical protein
VEVKEQNIAWTTSQGSTPYLQSALKLLVSLDFLRKFMSVTDIRDPKTKLAVRSTKFTCCLFDEG